MYKIFATAILSIIAAFTLTACGGDQAATPAFLPGSSVSSDAPGTAPLRSEPEPKSTEGGWVAENDGGMRAEVTGNTIEIYFHSDDTDALYWKGTFPEFYSDGVYMSQGDTEAMFMSLLGSQDSEKAFNLNEGKIKFSVSMMGMTRKITLKQS